MAREMKHVGKMKNNGAKILVAYRTLPGDATSALVIGTSSLPDTWHDTIMSIVQDISGQQANELADILAVRKFPDGENILASLHKRGLLKKVPTNGVIMTPATNASIQLDELNELIAQQKGISIEDLAVTDGTQKKKTAPKDDPTRTTSSSVNAGEEITTAPVITESKNSSIELTPAEMRSRADALFKQAQVLRKQADEIDPPKSKKKKEVETATE